MKSEGEKINELCDDVFELQVELTRLRASNTELLAACQAFRAIKFNGDWSWVQVVAVENLMDKAIAHAQGSTTLTPGEAPP